MVACSSTHANPSAEGAGAPNGGAGAGSAGTSFETGGSSAGFPAAGNGSAGLGGAGTQGGGGTAGVSGAGGALPGGAGADAGRSGSSGAGVAAGSGGASNGGTANGGVTNGGASGAGGSTNGGASGVSGNGGASGSATSCDPNAVNPSLLSLCTGNPKTCLLGGAVGHYDVTLLLGGPSASSTLVTGESRRFMLGETALAAGATRCVSFTVNVRTPEGQPIQEAAAHGTDGLNLRIEGASPALQALGVAPARNPVVLYIAGDSTVCDQDPQLNLAPEARYTGWGQMLPQFFVQGVSVTNYADSGESTAAFRTDGGSLWRPIQAGMKAGDYVFIQLGHNDKETPAATYRSRVTAMVRAVKAAGATPVLVTPMVRNTGAPLAEQHIYGDLNVRRELQAIASSEQTALIDLMLKSSEWVSSIGSSQAQRYFVGTDKTHSNELGAKLFADMVVSGIRETQLPLAVRLR